jgi:hypothetical protein
MFFGCSPCCGCCNITNGVGYRFTDLFTKSDNPPAVGDSYTGSLSVQGVNFSTRSQWWFDSIDTRDGDARLLPIGSVSQHRSEDPVVIPSWYGTNVLVYNDAKKYECNSLGFTVLFGTGTYRHYGDEYPFNYASSVSPALTLYADRIYAGVSFSGRSYRYGGCQWPYDCGIFLAPYNYWYTASIDSIEFAGITNDSLVEVPSGVIGGFYLDSPVTPTAPSAYISVAPSDWQGRITVAWTLQQIIYMHLVDEYGIGDGWQLVAQQSTGPADGIPPYGLLSTSGSCWIEWDEGLALLCD